uniref:Type I restriction-modification system, specificity subunit S n=1 Tax=uncultured bacterium A1Q1_fos_1880 TaxID=1256556 RepID=L7VZC4_9BACT|nr:type I restriction-modification system, specificity subunit S [uncultured bacterium A1Q1_fos_1880]
MYSKRVVVNLDELLARCATLERKLGQAQGAGRQLTAAVLQGVAG